MSFIVVIFDYYDNNIILYESNISTLSFFAIYTSLSTTLSSIYINSINFIHFNIINLFVIIFQDANNVFVNLDKEFDLNKRDQKKDVNESSSFRRRLKKQSK